MGARLEQGTSMKMALGKEPQANVWIGCAVKEVPEGGQTEVMCVGQVGGEEVATGRLWEGTRRH